MRQMLLDWGAVQPQTLDTFTIGRNAELLALLRRCVATPAAEFSDRSIYLWGDAGSGRTHLLQALAAATKARLCDATTNARALAFARDIPLYLIDDCEKLSKSAQIAAFNLFNQVRDNSAVLVAAGSVPPADLPIRADLRTRLGWGLVYQVHSLTDDEKIAALNEAAHTRGMTLSPGVLPYLITHYRRDMRSLSVVLDALDRYSLETQRPVTLPLLRDLLQLQEIPKA